ncbi:MAG TPA: tetratricopeptide repeat protein [Bacteroidales bacterium]|nr:tetratricopeptide repeat protein [Bacteroidales bacterium]
MKKFFLLIAVISISIGAMSQKGKVTSALSYIDQGQLDKAKEAIDQALLDEKSATWPNTFFAKGKLAQAAWESDNPKYKEFYKDALTEAYNAYEKAIELDPKGAIKKKIITTMAYSSLSSDFYNQGSMLFEAKDFKNALNSFETQIQICEGDRYVGAIDTGMYYNAGLAASNSGSYDAALKYFQKCADMKYMGITPYYQMYEAYLGKGDTTKAESTLIELPKLFPDDKTVTLQLIDLYIKSGKNAEAQKYIKIAKEADPTNYTLYFASGIIFLNEENYDSAIPELQKSIDLNPEVFDTQYGIGAAYINKAADMFKSANEIMDVKKYSEAVDAANAVYAKALPYMEKANQLNPEDVYTMRSLQELYYRMKLTDKYNAIKTKLEAAGVK